MRFLLALLLLAQLAACGFEPFDPPVPGEIPPGPGILTGPKGEFRIPLPR